MILKIIEKILDKIVSSNIHLQNYINYNYNRKGYKAISDEFLKDSTYKYNGYEFVINDQLDTISQVITDYDFSDMRGTDIVLDIGANIGAFTIFSAKKVKQIFAVEPIFADVLNTNLIKNNINNVTVFELGLGESDTQLIKYCRDSKIVKLVKLSELIKLCGGKVDFLKCDCEGGEWYIKSEELRDIRRIEMEIHGKNVSQFIKFETILKEAGFAYTKELEKDRKSMMIHGTNKLERI